MHRNGGQLLEQETLAPDRLVIVSSQTTTASRLAPQPNNEEEGREIWKLRPIESHDPHMILSHNRLDATNDNSLGSF